MTTGRCEAGSDRNQIPSEYQIRRYWATTDLAQRKGMDGLLLVKGVCFACVWDRGYVERAHIVPRSSAYGGTDHPSNIHMLCHACHLDSEWLTSHETYWPWFLERTIGDATFSSATRAINVHSTLERIRPGLGHEILGLIAGEVIHGRPIAAGRRAKSNVR